MIPTETTVLHANALDLPLDDGCVDLVVTSPPYFALRSYQDNGEHYDGQIGAEPTPAAFVAALLEVTREAMRVLKPGGSIWVNLGDKYATHLGKGSGHIGGNLNGDTATRAYRKTGNTEWSATYGFREKSLMGMPWRYALGCIDDLGLILRAEVIWSKPNGLPESVTDRVRRSHEQWFHFTKEPRYFSAVDEIREPHQTRDGLRGDAGKRAGLVTVNGHRADHVNHHALGKLPGSVWTIATEPLTVPQWARDKYNLPDHFAAFPQEWPRRIIRGWSPSGICVECGAGRRPVSQRGEPYDVRPTGRVENTVGTHGLNHSTLGTAFTHTITGEACACWANGVGTDPATGDIYICDAPPTRPAVVLDPFGGTGTTAGVAHALGRIGVSVDLSQDYCRLANWRIFESGHFQKSRSRTDRDNQGALFGDDAA